MKKQILFLILLSGIFFFISCGSSPDSPPAVKNSSDKDPKPLKIEWIEIPAGEFVMGSMAGNSDEKPAHRVYLETYYISKHEVTFAQYDRFCEEAGREKPDDSDWGRGNRPVINITWQAAKDYCKWLAEKTGKNILLPTEAQWEKAARGQDSRKYPWGNESLTGSRANFADLSSGLAWKDKQIDDGYKYTSPAGSYPQGASPYGVLDMGGNVWEWCNDWYDKYYYSRAAKKNPPGPVKGFYRVGRGGSWRYTAEYIRGAKRNFFYPDFGYSFMGFRLVKTE